MWCALAATALLIPLACPVSVTPTTTKNKPSTGRIFASDQSGDFTCHTYTILKPLNSQGAALLPHHDPGFARLPWARTGLVGWSLALLLGPLFGAALVGGVYSAVAAHLAKKRSSKVASGQKLAAVEAGLNVSKDTVTVTAVSGGSE